MSSVACVEHVRTPEVQHERVRGQIKVRLGWYLETRCSHLALQAFPPKRRSRREVGIRQHRPKVADVGRHSGGRQRRKGIQGETAQTGRQQGEGRHSSYSSPDTWRLHILVERTLRWVVYIGKAASENPQSRTLKVKNSRSRLSGQRKRKKGTRIHFI